MKLKRITSFLLAGILVLQSHAMILTAKDTPLPHNDGQLENPTFQEVRDNFKMPEMKYAPYEFWFWDQDLGTLDMKPEDMAHMLSEKGFNPGYAHARVNYANAFNNAGVPDLTQDQWLSQPWFDKIRDTALQAEADGTYFSFADDYNWPSLQAAGRLVLENPDLKPVSLAVETYDLEPGESITLPKAFFTVAGEIVSTQHSGYIKYFPDGNAFGVQSAYNDSTKPGVKQSRPYDYRAAYTGNSDAYVEFRPFIVEAGTYEVYSRWANAGNANNVAYQINAVETTDEIVNQSKDFLQWNLIGEYDFETGNDGYVKMANSGSGTISVDAMMFVNKQNPSDYIIIDDLDTNIRSIANLDSDSLKVINDDGRMFRYTAPDDGYYRVYSFSKVSRMGYDGAYINYLDKSLSEKFIDVAYKPYVEEMVDLLGGSMNGVFSDNEGDYGYKLAWSDDLADVYNERSGEDIKRLMPLMIDRDVDGVAEKARMNWFGAVSEIYTKNFTDVSDFAAEQGMYYTMHTWDESLQLIASCVGDYFEFNRGLTMPGTDALDTVAYNPQAFKDTGSVAEFEGRRLMTEVMALMPVGGYNPDELKRQANYMTTWNIGHVVTHAVKMTRYLAQHIVTPDFYDIDTMWEYMNEYTDFVRRTSYINSIGRSNAKVVLLNPLDSVMAAGEGDAMDYNAGTNSNVWEFTGMFGSKASEVNSMYNETIRLLSGAGIEYLTADKVYINEMQLTGDKLVRGDFEFETVVIPPMTIMDMDEAQKLVDFAKNGGNVYYLGELPNASIQNGGNDPIMIELMIELAGFATVQFLPDLEEALTYNYAGLNRAVELLDGNFEMLVHDRIIDGKRFVWVANNGTESCEASVYIEAKGNVEIWNPQTGEIRQADAVKNGDGVQVNLKFNRLDGLYVVIDPETQMQVPNSNVDYGGTVLNIDSGWTANIANVEDLVQAKSFDAITTNKIRLVARRGNILNQFETFVNELEIYSDDTNIAPQATLAASSGDPAPVIDGNDSTYWKNTKSTNENHVAWITFDFGSDKSINEIILKTQQGNAITDYRLEYWTGKAFKTIYSVDLLPQPQVLGAIDYPAVLLGEPIAVNPGAWNAWGILPGNFAGYIDYYNTFTIDSVTPEMYLDLGQTGKISNAILNGVDLGAKLWHTPIYDVSGIIKEGENDLKLRIGNLISENAYGLSGESRLSNDIVIRSAREFIESNVGGRNIARSATASASSVYPDEGYNVESIIDGNNSTKLDPPNNWVNAGGDSNRWATLEFDEEMNFDKVILYSPSSFAIKDYDIEVWKNNNWQVIASVRNNTSNNGVIISKFESQTSDKIRIKCINGPDSQSQFTRINEVEVYLTSSNLAELAQIDVTSTYDGYSKDVLCDGIDTGEDNESWVNAEEDTAPMVTLNFDAKQKMNNITITTVPSLPMRDFDLQIKQGNEWVTIANVRDNVAKDVTLWFEQFDTTSVRIVCLSGPLHSATVQAKFMRINEINIKNTRPEAGTDLIKVPQYGEVIALTTRPTPPVIENRLPKALPSVRDLGIELKKKEENTVEIDGKIYNVFECEEAEYGPAKDLGLGYVQPRPDGNANASGGAALGWWSEESWVKVEFYSDKTEDTSLILSYANNDGDAMFAVSVNGESAIDIVAPNQGNWSNYAKTAPVQIQLKKGLNEIYLTQRNTHNFANADAIFIMKDGAKTDGLFAEEPLFTYTNESGVNKIKAESMIENNTSDPNGTTIILAAYDDSGRLLKYATDSVELLADTTKLLQCELNLPEGGGKTTIKAFVWNSETNAPLCEYGEMRLAD